MIFCEPWPGISASESRRIDSRRTSQSRRARGGSCRPPALARVLPLSASALRTWRPLVGAEHEDRAPGQEVALARERALGAPGASRAWSARSRRRGRRTGGSIPTTSEENAARSPAFASAALPRRATLSAGAPQAAPAGRRRAASRASGRRCIGRAGAGGSAAELRRRSLDRAAAGGCARSTRATGLSMPRCISSRHVAANGLSASTPAGTKLLGGVVDEQLVVHHRVHRMWRGEDREETLDIIVEAVEEIRAAAPEVDAVASASSWYSCIGESFVSVHLPLEGVPFRDLMSERLGLPVQVDNDANVATLAEHRHGAAAGRRQRRRWSRSARASAAASCSTDAIYRGATGTGAELGHMVVDLDGPECPGACPGRGCLEAIVSGSGDRARRRSAWRPSARTRALGRPAGVGWRDHAARRHRAGATRATRTPARRSPRSGGSLGPGSWPREPLNPEMIVIGGGAMAAGDLLLGPARQVVAERALPPSRDGVRIVPAALRRGGRDARSGAAGAGRARRGR